LRLFSVTVLALSQYRVISVQVAARDAAAAAVLAQERALE
jgi:hypothetical protein